MVTLSLLGLNCGTSVDGIDLAHVHIESQADSPDLTISLRSYREHSIPANLRTKVLSLCRPGAPTTLEEICDLNFQLGEVFADAVEASGFDLSNIDAIASHGQTLWHTPAAHNAGMGYDAGERRMATLQMAESAVISGKTGVTTVSDFRVAELARSRMGAPLSGFFEAALLRHPTKLRLSQNVGGMGNVTVVPANSSVHATTYTAFDTGPGNVLMDATVRLLTNGAAHYDKDGALAQQGAADIDLGYIDEFLASLDYFTCPPPKTTGRELFSDDMAREIVTDLSARGLSTAAIVATVTRITCESIARAYETFVVPTYGPIDEVYICGGGAENPVIMTFLRERFPTAHVGKLDDVTASQSVEASTNERASRTMSEALGVGLPAAAKEAVLFAVLGFLCLTGMTVSIAACEACQAPAVLGKVTPGNNYIKIMRQALADASEGKVLGRINLV